MRTSWRTATAASLSAMLLLAGCATQVVGSATPVGGSATPSTGTATPATDPIPRPTAGGTGAGVVPPELAEFYNQKIGWGPCAPFATDDSTKELYAGTAFECADLIVPLSYTDPSGPTVAMAILRSVATGTDRIGSLLFNPGGPGASGMSMAAQLAQYQIGPALHERFDYVGFDTRGTGSSRPLVICRTDAEWDAQRARTYDTSSEADMAAAQADTEKQAANCAARTGAAEGIDGAAFLATVGSVDVVKDIDVLRSALGDEKLTYVGYSYGTLLGTLYAEAYPERVRAMVLDGAVDNSQTQEESLLGQAAGFQGAFEDFAADCATQPACVLGTDPAQATAVFQSLVRPLLTTPAPVTGGRVLSFSDATTGAIQAMYSTTLWPGLRSALLDLSKGDGTALMELADGYIGRDASGHYSSLMDAFGAIHCVDDTTITDPAQIKALNEKYAAAAPFLDDGRPASNQLDVCAYWPAPVTLQQHTPSAPGLPKIMVVSTTGDPATPYQAGVDLATDLGASLVSIEGTQHTGFLVLGDTCVDDAGIDYLVDLTSPADGLSC